MIRRATLPLAAIVLVLAVIGIQLGNGGGDYAPAKAADPCAPRQVASVSKGIDGLTERLVLLGLDGAGCRLGMTREALTLQLAQQPQPTDAQVAALHAGLLGAVDRMKADGTLPPAADLTDEALDRSDLNFFVKKAIGALPDSLINKVIKTDDVLKRTINNLDLRKLLTNLDNPDEVNQQINKAVTKAVKDALISKLRDLI